MGYPFEDLDDSQFERLVVQCSRKLFGVGVQSFSTGPDGGRDARFHGVAERFPSSQSPWRGITVIQAKHTIATNAHFSDADFSSDAETSTLTKEILRIKKLAEADEVENYMLFSNRRLGGVVGPEITNRIADEVGLPRARVWLAGTEYLDDMLHQYRDLPILARLDPVDAPLNVSSYELAEVILAIARGLDVDLPSSDAPVVDRVSYNEKNSLNNMSNEFALTLSKRYLAETRRIGRFLADPANTGALRMYEGAVDEFQIKIIAKRRDYQSFDDVFNYLVDFLAKRDAVLARNRRLLRAMVFYMYWHCDIGESVDAEAE
ncbi:ABC-three component system protein [Geodermatophilus sp. URMC 60]